VRPRPRPPGLRPPRPWHGVLALLVAAQWGAAAWVASAAAHTGRLYGDPQETAALHGAARAVLHGHLPHDGGGFLWPVLTAPFAAAGSAPSAGLAALVLVQVVVLLPAALLAVVGTASELAGRAFGAFAGAVWILLPLAGYHYFDFRMKPPTLDLFLPQALGLADSTAFPATVAVAVAAYLLVRALRSGSPRDAAWAGLAASVAAALSVAAVVFVAAALAALALRRRSAPLGVATAAALPGLLAALLWHLHAPHAGAPVLHWDWGQFHANVMGFREYGWSLRVVEWLPIAGTIALLRRSPATAVALAGGFWAFVLLRGAVPNTFSTGDGLHPSAGFLVLLLPALPAFSLLVAALPLLVPRLPARLAPFPRPAG
jgi:hypothetical protein